MRSPLLEVTEYHILWKTRIQRANLETVAGLADVFDIFHLPLLVTIFPFQEIKKNDLQLYTTFPNNVTLLL